MKLWTMQPPEVYQLIQEIGVYRCNPELSENQEWCFCKAYNWLHGKMESLIGPAPDGVSDPVWAWHTWEGHRKKPDFRYSMFRNHPECYLMEIDIEDDQVLLTDYDDWHYVLNRWYYHDEDPDDIWDERNEWFWSLPPDEQTRIAEESWNQLIGRSEAELLHKKSPTIQATFWELRRDQIGKVWHH